MAPASTSLCPARYLVALWITRSAPRAMACGHKVGGGGGACWAHRLPPAAAARQLHGNPGGRLHLCTHCCTALPPPTPPHLLVDGRGKGGVDHHHGILCGAQLLNARDVHAAHVGVGGALAEEQRHLRAAASGQSNGGGSSGSRLPSNAAAPATAAPCPAHPAPCTPRHAPPAPPAAHVVLLQRRLQRPQVCGVDDGGRDAHLGQPAGVVCVCVEGRHMPSERAGCSGNSACEPAVGTAAPRWRQRTGSPSVALAPQPTHTVWMNWRVRR